MFNTISSYLLGGSSEDNNAQLLDADGGDAEASAQQPAGRLEEPKGIVPKKHYLLVSPSTAQDKADFGDTKENDEDWILIDTKEATFEVDEFSLSDASSLPPTSCEPSAPSTPASGWNLTPPACFEGDTRNADEYVPDAEGALATSNFENLLIEHPSMSVYHQRSDSPFASRRPNRRTSSPVHVVPDGGPRRQISLLEFLPPSVRDQLSWSGPLASQRHAQRAEEVAAKLSLSARKLDRGNRSREVESAGRRSASRSKKIKNNCSGRNNDRKSH